MLERLTKRIRPLGQQETFTYDANGNQVSHPDFNGQTTTFTYNAVNQLTAKTLPGGTVVSYAFTSSGLRTQAGGDSYTYDTRGRLVQEHKASGEVLSYTYDAAGNKTSLTTPQGTTTYTYDALNRLATVVDTTGTTRYTYDSVGNLTGTAYPNGDTTAYTYDTLNRLTQMTNTGPNGLISLYTYTLGAAGNRLQVVEAGPATTGRTVSCTYDAVYRLTQEAIDEPGTVNDQTITYSYDAVGNRTQMNRAGVITTYTYDINDRLLTEASSTGSFPSTYDANGNLKTHSNGTSTDSYTYDGENQLISASVQTGTSPGAVTYTYDADGMRTSKTASGVTTTFLLDKNRAFAQVVVETVGSTIATYTYGNQLISQTRTGGGTHFYLSDGQLSTRQLTTSTGLVTDTYTYDAFGVTLASTGATQNVYLYTGEQFDPNMGFYYLRARYYNQGIGRFITTDPLQGNIFDPVSLHRYLYANGDPVNKADPSGAFVIELLVFLFLVVVFNQYRLSTLHTPKQTEFSLGTRDFRLRLCPGGVQGGAGPGLGIGTAVIAEQKAQPALQLHAAKYQVFYSGFTERFGFTLPSTIMFQRRLKTTVGGFGGTGSLGSFGTGGFIISLGESTMTLPDETKIVENFKPSDSAATHSHFGVTAFRMDWTLIDSNPGYTSASGVSCDLP